MNAVDSIKVARKQKHREPLRSRQEDIQEGQQRGSSRALDTLDSEDHAEASARVIRGKYGDKHHSHVLFCYVSCISINTCRLNWPQPAVLHVLTHLPFTLLCIAHH